MCLKDCSAYNVQFHRGRPIFIDTLSFETYREGKPWVGYRQFCEHFLAPWRHGPERIIGSTSSAAPNIDGIPLDLAVRLLPARSRLRWGLPCISICTSGSGRPASAADTVAAEPGCR